MLRFDHLLMVSCLAAAASSALAQNPPSPLTPPSVMDDEHGATAVYWRRSEEGWFWYQDPKERVQPPVTVPKPTAPTAPFEPPEVQALKELQRKLEEARTVAVMNPTEANVQAYLFAQKEAFDRSSAFADTWRRVVWTTPELDYATKGRPTNSEAIQSWDKDQTRKKQAWVANLAATHGLFFFFRGDCAYCHAAAPVLADFSRRYGLPVFAVSLDGSTLPDFPSAVRDAGQARSLGVSSVPALFLAKPGSREVQPIGYGVLAASDILERIWVLSQPGGSF